MPEPTMDIQPIAGALGAEIGSVDLTNLDDETFTAIHDAFLKHLVIFFRDQDLSPEQHKALSRRFGEPYIHPYLAPVERHPAVVQIGRAACREGVCQYGQITVGGVPINKNQDKL